MDAGNREVMNFSSPQHPLQNGRMKAVAELNAAESLVEDLLDHFKPIFMTPGVPARRQRNIHLAQVMRRSSCA